MLLSWCLWDTLVVWVHSTSETTKQNDPPISMELITESISTRVEVDYAYKESISDISIVDHRPGMYLILN
jgi:hypothetical protein